MVLAMTCLGYELPEERRSLPSRRPGLIGGHGCRGKPTTNVLLPCDPHLLLERRQTDRADDHFGADNIARRAVEPERLGDTHVLLQRGLDLVSRHVLLDARHVEADLLGDRECVGAIGLAP